MWKNRTLKGMAPTNEHMRASRELALLLYISPDVERLSALILLMRLKYSISSRQLQNMETCAASLSHRMGELLQYMSNQEKGDGDAMGKMQKNSPTYYTACSPSCTSKSSGCLWTDDGHCIHATYLSTVDKGRTKRPVGEGPRPGRPGRPGRPTGPMSAGDKPEQAPPLRRSDNDIS